MLASRLGAALLTVLALYAPVALLLLLGPPPVRIAATALAALLPGLVSAALTTHVVRALGRDAAKTPAVVRRGLHDAIRAAPVALATSLLVGAGYGLLVVPGIVATALLSLSVPIAIVERASLRTALARSVRLSKGARWATLFVLGLSAVLGGVAARASAIVLGELGWVLGFMLQSALAGAAWTVLYVGQRRIHDGVELDELVRSVGGVPGGEARALDAAVEAALAHAEAAPLANPTTMPPVEVSEEALASSTAARDARMRRMRALGAFAMGTLLLVGAAGSAWSWRSANLATAADEARRVASLRTADAHEPAVLETIVLRRDLYGDTKDIVQAMATGGRARAQVVTSHLEAELSELGCGLAVPAAKRGNGGAFAKACPAAPLVAEEAHRVAGDALALATVLEARATKRGKGRDPVHELVVQALIRTAF